MTGFTPAESAVAACLLDHMQDKEIAAATGISYAMVRKHLRRLLDRFGVFNRRHLAQQLRQYA